MPAPKINCTATNANGRPCSAWAMHKSNPPLCSAHAGITGAPQGNTNAVTHGYYQSGVTRAEMSALFTEAEKVTLIQEATLIRVVLNRLIKYVVKEDPSAKELTTIAPLIFTGTRALAFVQKHLPDPNAIDWNATLDELAEELDWDI
jgi:hypothetical protein